MKFKEFLPLVIGQSIKLHQRSSRYKVKFSFNLERRLFWLPVTVSYTEGLGFIWAACEAQVFGYRTRKQTEVIIWRPVICTEVSVCSESNYSCARQNITMATLLTQFQRKCIVWQDSNTSQKFMWVNQLKFWGGVRGKNYIHFHSKVWGCKNFLCFEIVEGCIYFIKNISPVIL